MLSTKGHNFLFGRMYFTGENDYQNFWVFASMLNSLALDNNKTVANWSIPWKNWTIWY